MCAACRLIKMVQGLLFVCLGNICRSPAAEGVFLNLIKLQGLEENYKVDSAGTGSWHVGNPADSRMRNAAKRRGIDLPSISRQITFNDLQTFDLILTMDNENLQVVKALASKHVVDDCANIRPILSYAKKTDLIEVPDPYYGGEDGFEKVLDLLEDACQGLLSEIN